MPRYFVLVSEPTRSNGTWRGCTEWRLRRATPAQVTHGPAAIHRNGQDAQSGLLTHHPDRGYAKLGRYPSLDERVSGMPDQTQTVLMKLFLPEAEVRRLRSLLDREGLTDAHLKPTLDNVASTAMKRCG